MNIIIYKIFSKNASDNVYVGSTKNLKNRSRLHKSNCKNPLSKNYNSRLYVHIRNNGGFENFIIEEIETYKCINTLEARQHERHFYDLLLPDLNTNKPLLTDDERKETIKNNSAKYYINNKDYANNKRKINYQENKERDLNYQKLYREKQKLIKKILDEGF